MRNIFRNRNNRKAKNSDREKSQPLSVFHIKLFAVYPAMLILLSSGTVSAEDSKKLL